MNIRLDNLKNLPLIIIPLLLFSVSILIKLQLMIFAYLFICILFVYFIFMDFHEVKTSVRKCIVFLIANSLLGTLFFAAIIIDSVLPYFNIKVPNDDFGLVYQILIFTVIYLFFYVYVYLKADTKVFKLSTYIIVTIVTIIYTLASMAINFTPTSTLNQSIISASTHGSTKVEEFFREYDARTFYNLVVQMFTYPIWVVSLIGCTLVEIKQYLTETKSTLKDKIRI